MENFGKKALIILVLIGAVLTSSVYKVSEQEVGVVYTFGKYTKTEKNAGFHLKVPVAQQVAKVSTVTNAIQVGYTSDGVSVNRKTDDAKEGFLEDLFKIEDSDNEDDDADDWEHVKEDFLQLTTSDEKIVNMNFYAEWRITDPIQTQMKMEDVEDRVSKSLEGEIRQVVSNYTANEMLTDKRAIVGAEIKDVVNKNLAEDKLGVAVTSIRVQDSEPPTKKVQKAYRNVENAKQNMGVAINKAQSEYNKTIPHARAEADKIINEAETYKQQRILDAEGQVARFNEVYKEYRLAPEPVGRKLYYEMIDEILPKLEVIVDGNGDSVKIIEGVK